MPYDPTKPANGSPIASAELRTQFAGLKSLIDAKTNEVDLIPTIQANAAGPTDGVVNYLNLVVSNPPTQAEVQSIADKLDELITALNRV